MNVSPDRIARDIAEIAKFSEVAVQEGYSRPTFSQAWEGATEYLAAELRALGCKIHRDAAGNLRARPADLSWNAPAWLSGSHLDSVPTGGRFDGVVGVVAALEVLRACPAAPLELIAFSEEEGTTFGLGMVGSRLWSGSLAVSTMQELRNRMGATFAEAGSPYGVRTHFAPEDRLDPRRYRGFIELHVEQGAGLWNQNVPVAVVTAANGRRQFLATVRGSANHAGSTRMSDRRDSLAGAAEMVLAVESLARSLDGSVPHSVLTVGKLVVHPNAFNVIPGAVEFTVDLRARLDATLDEGETGLHTRLESIAADRKLDLDISRIEALPVVPMDSAVCAALRAAASRKGLHPLDVVSGALHDAVILAPFLPTAMLFIASRDGISHHPSEFSRLEDITLATEILAETVTS
ncbi:MAG TPA: Zn-dependent hydrolase [Pirellulaceae bacterium]